MFACGAGFFRVFLKAEFANDLWWIRRQLWAVVRGEDVNPRCECFDVFGGDADRADHDFARKSFTIVFCSFPVNTRIQSIDREVDDVKIFQVVVNYRRVLGDGFGWDFEHMGFCSGKFDIANHFFACDVIAVTEESQADSAQEDRIFFR